MKVGKVHPSCCRACPLKREMHESCVDFKKTTPSRGFPPVSMAAVSRRASEATSEERAWDYAGWMLKSAPVAADCDKKETLGRKLGKFANSLKAKLSREGNYKRRFFVSATRFPISQCAICCCLRDVHAMMLPFFHAFGTHAVTCKRLSCVLTFVRS